MDGKVGLVMGVANKRSIAWATAKLLYERGASLILTYQNERLKRNLDGLVETLPQREGQFVALTTCDVTNPQDIEKLAAFVAEKAKPLDFFFHSIAYATREALTGRFLDTQWEDYSLALQVSSYSLLAVTRALEPYFREGDSAIATMTYLGSEKAVPGYNVMGVAKAALEASVRYMAAELGQRGVRVNAISAGPVRTLAAAGIPGFSKMLENYKEKNMARQALEAQQVAEIAVFLLGPQSQAITGTVVYVDHGYHAVGI